MSLSPLLHLFFLSAGTWLLAAAALASLPRLSAARRHLVWQASFAVVAACSPLAFLDVRFSLPVLPAESVVAAQRSMETASSPPLFEGKSPAVRTGSTATAIQAAPVLQRPSATGFDWTMVVWLVWALGAFMVALRFISGFLILRGVRRRSRLVGRSDEGGFLSSETKAGVPVYASGEIGTPMAIGILSPAVLVPEGLLPEAGSHNSAFLLHELGHVKRADAGFLLLAGIVTAIHWFNPLAWLAASRFRIEAERAADDDALRGPASAAEYAEGLLAAVRRLKPDDSRLFPAARMADSSKIGARLSRLLDEEMDRSAPTARARGLVISGTIAIGIATLVIRPVAAQQPDSPDNQATFHADPTPAPSAPYIEIEFKLIEVGEETYVENRERFDKAMRSSSESSCQDFLQFLNQCRNVDFLSTPKVTTLSGQRATVRIVREFPFPVEFGDSGQLIASDTKDLGVSFEVVPKLIGDKIVVNGTLRVSDFLGFADGEGRMPSFQTKEVWIFRELKKDEVAVMLVPWQIEETGLRPQLNLSSKKPDPIPVGKRLVLVLKASLPVAPRRLTKTEGEKYMSDLLAKTRLQERNYEKAPVTDVISHMVAQLMDANKNGTAVGWDSSIVGKIPEVTLNTKGMTADEVLAEIKRQTGVEYSIEGSTLRIGSSEEMSQRKKVVSADLPYGTPVPNKPGFVISPYAPDSDYVDLRGYLPGDAVKCPYTQKMFLVP